MSSLTSEILAAYRYPRLSFERQLAKNVGDDRILFYGMLACFLAFVARIPSLFHDSMPDRFTSGVCSCFHSFRRFTTDGTTAPVFDRGRVAHSGACVWWPGELA